MADRYWVGGAGAWDGTAGTKWATTSGGAGGASVPTSVDNVFLNAASGAVAVSLSLSSSICRTLDCTGFTGNLVMTSSTFTVHGGITFSSTMTLTNPGTCTVNLRATSGSFSITSNGKVFPGVTTMNIGVTLNGSTAVISLADAFTVSTLAVASGTFNTSGFTANIGAISNIASGTALNFGASTVNLSGTTPINFGGTSVNMGTSQFNISNSQPTFNGGGRTFYNVSFTGSSAVSRTITGVNTFNNLSIQNRAASGVSLLVLGGNQTINGTFTVTSSSDTSCRTFVRSGVSTLRRTLTCGATSFTNADFRSIEIAGAAAPASGTRIGDCKNNVGITFPAAKTVFWRGTASSTWGAAFPGNWSFTSGGLADDTAFPLAQDTAVFPAATYPTAGATVTVNADYNIGTIDMSLRTGNSMTLAISTLPSVYGNWINGTLTTMSGTGFIFFDGTNVAQTITSAGRTFTQSFSITGGNLGSVTLLDSLTINNASSGITLNSGTFDANGFNVTLLNAANMQAASGNDARTLAIGTGLWTVAASGVSAWNTGGTGFTATGTGTIRLNSFSNKTFGGNGSSYAGITLDQGGSGALAITSSNTFGNITNSYASVGATSINFQSGQTTTVSNFTASGQSGRQLSIGRSGGTNGILSKATGTVSVSFCTITGNTATGGATWEAFTINGNVNGGSNVGWLFSNLPPSTGNMLMMFLP